MSASAKDAPAAQREPLTGLIADSWKAVTLADAVDFLDSQRRPVKDSDRARMEGHYPYYGASGVIDYVNDYLFDEDLILLGEDGENIISRNSPLAFRITGKTWVNNHAHVLRPRNGFDISFLVEYLESIDYRQYNTGTAQPKLNKEICSGIPVVQPPIAEQRAIAAALSDVDALTGVLDKLIAKKRAIKLAAMQQLLSGKGRLSGFSAEWQVKRLCDLAEIVSGATPSTNNQRYWGGGIPWCTPTDITSCRGTYLATTERTVTKEGLAACAARLLPKGSLLLCSRATVGEVRIAATAICTNQGFKSLVCKYGVSNVFVFYKLLTMKLRMLEKAIGSTFPEISKSDTAALTLTVPELAEQQAIAAVLSDMDAEIFALEHRRDKTKAIKQGMMQQLLTGKTRLV